MGAISPGRSSIVLVSTLAAHVRAQLREMMHRSGRLSHRKSVKPGHQPFCAIRPMTSYLVYNACSETSCKYAAALISLCVWRMPDPLTQDIHLRVRIAPVLCHDIPPSLEVRSSVHRMYLAQLAHAP